MFFISQPQENLECKKKSFYEMYLLGIYDFAYIIAYCNYMAILSSLFCFIIE